jgi:hypothetical protein
MASTIERRPDSRGYSATTFPPEWGEVPSSADAREKWAAENVRKGIEARANGQDVPWLAKPETRA